jgi:hypothetical protein
VYVWWRSSENQAKKVKCSNNDVRATGSGSATVTAASAGVNIFFRGTPTVHFHFLRIINPCKNISAPVVNNEVDETLLTQREKESLHALTTSLVAPLAFRVCTFQSWILSYLAYLNFLILAIPSFSPPQRTEFVQVKFIFTCRMARCHPPDTSCQVADMPTPIPVVVSLQGLQQPQNGKMQE